VPITPLANGAFTIREFSEASPVAGVCALIGALGGVLGSAAGDRIENGGWGALLGGIVGLCLSASGAL
jgi:hypothetical protein